jgi:hypothetical protein
MDPKRKLQHRTEQELAQDQQLSGQQRQVAREFGTVEELLRHDAAHTQVPPAVAARLQQSIAREPAPRASWWRRLFNS